MLQQSTSIQQYFDLIQRTNAIARFTDLEPLLDHMLDILCEITHAQGGIVYLYYATRHEMICTAITGRGSDQALVGQRWPAEQGNFAHALELQQPLWQHHTTSDQLLPTDAESLNASPIDTLYTIPLLQHQQSYPEGIVQLFNVPSDVIDNPTLRDMAWFVCERLVPDIYKSRLLYDAHRQQERQQKLIDIASQITNNLNHDQVLDRIMDYASDLLDVEAASIWLLKEASDQARSSYCLNRAAHKHLVLYVATGERKDYIREISIPSDQGIIGHVITTGEAVVENDVRANSHFYDRIDRESGFETRSILCVPLKASNIQLGGRRGEIEEMIIGGVQALNKRNGRPFSQDDVRHLETLANQAATVLQLARLYDETDTLFWGFIDAITSAIDLKDPWMSDHSRRVSEFSMAIAEELPLSWWPQTCLYKGKLSSEMLYHIRVGSQLHDIGKLRISDRILNKPAHLDEDEMSEMKRHAEYGVDMLKTAGLARLLDQELPALHQHHERLDGSGYPKGLIAEEISHIGRIVAVADMFDAMTSDRPYRKARTAEETITILRGSAGRECDPECVEALARAYHKGLICPYCDLVQQKLVQPQQVLAPTDSPPITSSV
ncbi:MAG: GAF domain-containing protein [Chloroflexaceae bacterium]|nr:GAF domain-containing protein [Chloroflexaceae bacterium]